MATVHRGCPSGNDIMTHFNGTTKKKVFFYYKPRSMFKFLLILFLFHITVGHQHSESETSLSEGGT